jgi:hypothetical protein
LWCQRQPEMGEVKPKPRATGSQSLKINDWEKFEAFVKAHGDKSQSEMAQPRDGEISQPTIWSALQKMKYTRKKNLWLYLKGRSQTSGLSRPTRRPLLRLTWFMSMSRPWMNGIIMAKGTLLLGNASRTSNQVGCRGALI